jgi:hypothetical protein
MPIRILHTGRTNSMNAKADLLKSAFFSSCNIKLEEFCG